MDKQLIEQIIEVAYEDAMGQSLRPKDRREVVRVCVAFLARIDAERGKEAAAWVNTLDTAQPRCVTNLDYRSVAEAELGVEYIPLFLSPAIPEGMALVPPEKPLPDLMLASYHEAIGWNACREALIAAAQGGRNA